MTTEHDATVLVRAARIGGYAPSIHNTQPWRWRVSGSDVGADRAAGPAVDRDRSGRAVADRQLRCGAAPRPAGPGGRRVAAQVDRLPDVLDPNLLAASPSATTPRPAPSDPARAGHPRPAHRPPAGAGPARRPGRPVELRDICEAEGARLHLLGPDDIIELARPPPTPSTSRRSTRRGATKWSTGPASARPADAGVPADGHPRPTRPAPPSPAATSAAGTLPVGPGHDRYARYAILYADTDEPRRLAARRRGALRAVAGRHREGPHAVPLSAAIEIPAPAGHYAGCSPTLGRAAAGATASASATPTTPGRHTHPDSPPTRSWRSSPDSPPGSPCRAHRAGAHRAGLTVGSAELCSPRRGTTAHQPSSWTIRRDSTSVGSASPCTT